MGGFQQQKPIKDMGEIYIYNYMVDLLLILLFLNVGLLLDEKPGNAQVSSSFGHDFNQHLRDMELGPCGANGMSCCAPRGPLIKHPESMARCDLRPLNEM